MTPADLSLPPLSGLVTQNRQIAAAMRAVGGPAFFSCLADLCETASGYTDTFISAFIADNRPVELFSNLDHRHSDTTIAPYIEFAYLLDPFYDLFRKGTGDALVTLNECAPDDFKVSEYYRTFYADTGLYDEASMFISYDTNASIVLSVGSRQRNFVMDPEGRAALHALLPVVGALCRQHWPTLAAISWSSTGWLGRHLELAFARFGTSVLSEREAQTMRLVLKGHSSKSIARLLGNSPETVKVLRKRIYVKLDIASQGELFDIFFTALTQTPPNATGDPLTYLASDGAKAFPA